MKRAVVMGAGPAGLKAGYELARAGIDTTIIEAAPGVGGLASSFHLDGVEIERYYHFICRGDDELVETLEDLGLQDRLRWRASRMAYFVDGQLYPFLTPADLLRFRPLSVANRLRAGVALKRAQRAAEEDLASRRAIPWLRHLFGDEAYRVIWEPLMRFKFAHYAPDVSAAWIWARMVRLSRSRVSPWREDLGYLEGGSRVVLEGLARAFQREGGRLVLGQPAQGLELSGGRVSGVHVAGERLRADAVVSTITPSRLVALAPTLASSVGAGLRRVPVIGIFCVLLRLKRPITPFFWVNTNDRRVPFAGMIEYTNLNPLPALEGDRILYIPQYVAVEDPRYGESDASILARYYDALALLHPAFEPAWVRQAIVFRDRYAQPICLTDYRETTPPIRTTVPGLFLTDSSQLHPHDRNISGSLGLGRQAARLALDDLGALA